MGRCWVNFQWSNKFSGSISSRSRGRIRKRLNRVLRCQERELTVEPLPRLCVQQHLGREMSPAPSLPRSPESVDMGNTDPTDITFDNTKLFTGSHLCRDDLLLIIFGFIMRYQLTRSAVSDLIRIFGLLLPAESDFPGSYYQLLRSLPKKLSKSKVHYYCPKCQCNLVEHLKFEERQCRDCQQVFAVKELERKGNFYVTSDLRRTFTDLLCDPGLCAELVENLEKRSTASSLDTCRREITDGKLYKALRLDQWDLTCSVNTDGVSPFNSSKVSLWPILISLNELSYKSRKKTILIGGLWFGSHKPNFDSFFANFVKQCQDLAVEGITWKCNTREYHSKIFFPIFVSDSVARCQCQGIHQFNGSYGCPWCLCKGESYSYGLKSRKWIYRGTSDQERDHEQFIGHLQVLCEKISTDPKASHYGIVQPSQLLLVPSFDIVWSFTYDVMHSAFLGVTRSFGSYWFDSQYHERPFYIGRKVSAIDEALMKLSVPGGFSRTIRPLELRKFWKANEWRTFTFIFPLLFKDILPEPFFKHFCKYVQAMMLLCGTSVANEDIVNSKKLLHEFVNDLEQIYGPEFCSSNAHLLLHAPSCVENWGPLWAYSAFPFENYNGTLGKLFNGSRRIEVEIVKKLDLCSNVLSEFLPRVHNDNIEFGINLLVHSSNNRVAMKIGNCVKMYGIGKPFHFNTQERSKLSKAGHKCARAISYKRFSVSSVFYTTSAVKASKVCDFVCEISGKFYIINNVFEAGGTAFGFFQRLYTVRDNFNTFIYKVTGKALQNSVLSLENLNSKFIAKMEGGELKNIIMVPNSYGFD